MENWPPQDIGTYEQQRMKRTFTSEQRPSNGIDERHESINYGRHDRHEIQQSNLRSISTFSSLPSSFPSESSSNTTHQQNTRVGNNHAFPSGPSLGPPPGRGVSIAQLLTSERRSRSDEDMKYNGNEYRGHSTDMMMERRNDMNGTENQGQMNHMIGQVSPEYKKFRREGSSGSTLEENESNLLANTTGLTSSTGAGGGTPSSNGSISTSASNNTGRRIKLSELERHVQQLEDRNLDLKQMLLLDSSTVQTSQFHATQAASIRERLTTRKQLVQNVVDHLNHTQSSNTGSNGSYSEESEDDSATSLSAADIRRWYHPECRVAMGVYEWDAVGHNEILRLWRRICSMFASITMDNLEVRPHLPDGEMIMTKWRFHGRLASQAELTALSNAPDCSPVVKAMLQSISTLEITFTVTTQMIFQGSQIIAQHHSWDQVAVFKRLVGGKDFPKVIQDLLALET